MSQPPARKRPSAAATTTNAVAAAVSLAAAAGTSKGLAKPRNERNILTFYEKIAVIRYYEETNISRNSLAKMFHCCATQIRRILERKQELLNQLETLSDSDAAIILEEMTRKRRKFEMSAISFILHQWVERCRVQRARKSITNDTLKEIALKMATLLNLPSFKPSYRWLNRFRIKYKYEEQDLGVGSVAVEANGGAGVELSVEDIIIEFKDSLPSFMQKEIAAITAASAAGNNNNNNSNHSNQNANLKNENSIDFVDSGDDDDDDVTEVTSVGGPDTAMATSQSTNDGGLDSRSAGSTPAPTPATVENGAESRPEEGGGGIFHWSGGRTLNAATATLQNAVFPHLYIIYQFAVSNCDTKALELITALGTHMQTQAADGAYRHMTFANTIAPQQGEVGDDSGISYGDIDDIVLIE